MDTEFKQKGMFYKNKAQAKLKLLVKSFPSVPSCICKLGDARASSLASFTFTMFTDLVFSS